MYYNYSTCFFLLDVLIVSIAFGGGL